MKLVKITGPQGSGKTTALDELLEAAGAAGLRLHSTMADGALARSLQRAVTLDNITTVGIDECTPTQIAMLEVMCKDPAWPDVTIHVVVPA